MKSQLDQQKAFGEQRVLDTEESKPKLDQEEHAKLGTNKLHTSIAMVSIRNQVLVKKLTTAETQVVVTPSGATPLIQRRDGNTVIPSFLVILLKAQVKKIFQERTREEVIEVLRERPEKENNAYLGILKQLEKIDTQQGNIQKMI